MNTPVRDRSEALGRLAAFAPRLHERGVTSLRTFGSAGHEAMTAERDVDILVAFDRPIGAFEFLDLQDDLARMLGRPVDLVTPACRTIARTVPSGRSPGCRGIVVLDLVLGFHQISWLPRAERSNTNPSRRRRVTTS